MISPPGLTFLTLIEGGMQLVEYEDSGGVGTIALGHAIKRHERDLYPHPNGVMTITQSEGEEFLRADLEWVYRVIRGTVHPKLEQHEFDALCAFIFNIGGNQWRTSTALRKLNQGKKRRVGSEMTRWIMDEGERSQGLWNRRCATGALWLFADYNPDHILLGTV